MRATEVARRLWTRLTDRSSAEERERERAELAELRRQVEREERRARRLLVARETAVWRHRAGEDQPWD